MAIREKRGSSFLGADRDSSLIYRLIKARQIPCFHVGSDYRLDRKSIEAWLRAQEAKSVPVLLPTPPLISKVQPP